MNQDRIIQITKLPQADALKKQALVNSIEKAYDRLNNLLPGELTLEIHFRESRKHGKREQFEVKTNAVVEGISLHASFIDWDSEKALKKVLDSLEKEALKAKSLKK